MASVLNSSRTINLVAGCFGSQQTRGAPQVGKALADWQLSAHDDAGVLAARLLPLGMQFLEVCYVLRGENCTELGRFLQMD